MRINQSQYENLENKDLNIWVYFGVCACRANKN